MIAMIEKLAPAKNKHKISFEIQAIKQHDNDVSEGLTTALDFVAKCIEGACTTQHEMAPAPLRIASATAHTFSNTSHSACAGCAEYLAAAVRRALYRFRRGGGAVLQDAHVRHHLHCGVQEVRQCYLSRPILCPLQQCNDALIAW